MPDKTDTTDSPTTPPAPPTTAVNPLEVQVPVDGGGLAPAPERLEVPASKKPLCPVCKTALDVYTGGNLHKLSTAWCPRCGRRHQLVS